MGQSGRMGDKANKHKSPAKSGRVGISAMIISNFLHSNEKIEARACKMTCLSTL